MKPPFVDVSADAIERLLAPDNGATTRVAPIGAKLRGVCGSFCSLSPLADRLQGEGSGEGLSARADSRKAKVPFNGAHNRSGTSRKV